MAYDAATVICKGIQMPENVCDHLLNAVAEKARQSQQFASVAIENNSLVCRARDVESEAFYRIGGGAKADVLLVALYTPDRWLSESIESDLMHLGESLESLLEEELVEMGVNETLAVEHFRDDDKQYVFQSSVSLPASHEPEAQAQRLTKILLSYEACFRELGDMAGEADA